MRYFGWSLFLLSALAGCDRGLRFPAAKDCKADNNCYVQYTIDTLNALSSEINYWDNIYFYSIVVAGICGIVAAVMIALQDNTTMHWTKPIGITATALVTGITALTASLHIPETKDKLIDVSLQLTNKVNNFEHDVEDKSGKAADDVRKKYADEFALIKGEILRTKGSPARFNLGQPAPPGGQAPKPP